MAPSHRSLPETELRALVALFEAGRFRELEAQARALTSRHADVGFLWKALSVALQAQGKDALAAAEHAARLLPNDAEAHSHLGMAYRTGGRIVEAVASYRRALSLKPNYAEAHHNLGNALQNLGQLDEAVASYRQALAIKPAYIDAFDNLLFCLTQSQSIEPQALFEEHCGFATRYEEPLRSSWTPHDNAADPDRPIRVGISSGDLCSHAVANFFEPILSYLATDPRLSLHAYYNNTAADHTTARMHAHFTQWRGVAGMTDDALARQIRADGIDILIDLAGHTAKNRLLTFARKPAPVQASWIGYPGTTGLGAMDYYISDHFLLPPGELDDQFTEALAYLPASVPFLPSPDAPPVNALPALSNGYVTFGSFNRPAKISRSVVALWSQVLREVADARMLIGGLHTQSHGDTLNTWFAAEGIASDRLRFEVRGDMPAYLGLHHHVDLCLDTFPYNGGTTTYHALWMGVPTLTLVGRTAAGRPGAAILGRVGLDGFTARSHDDFVRAGVYWAAHLAELSAIRARLRQQFSASATGQPAVIAQGLSRALCVMWQRWCAGQPASTFAVRREDLEQQ